jgi:hypothetical protein
MNNQIFGLIDSLEAVFLEARKIPFTDKIIIEEKKVLILLDKLRLILKKGDSVVRESIESASAKQALLLRQQLEASRTEKGQQGDETDLAQNIIQEACQKAAKIESDTNAYSEYILANLQLMVTKIQKNLINIEKNLETTRANIEPSLQQDEKSLQS